MVLTALGSSSVLSLRVNGASPMPPTSCHYKGGWVFGSLVEPEGKARPPSSSPSAPVVEGGGDRQRVKTGDRVNGQCRGPHIEPDGANVDRKMLARSFMLFAHQANLAGRMRTWTGSILA